MKIKTNELTGPALDWAVSTAHGGGKVLPSWFIGDDYALAYSADWRCGGPIITRSKINLEYEEPDDSGRMPAWFAWIGETNVHPFGTKNNCYGPTPLIAAMRCYVISTLGDEVDVPEELL